MPKNDSKKNRSEAIEDNVRKAYGDENVSNVLSGTPEELKDKVAAQSHQESQRERRQYRAHLDRRWRY